MILWLPDFRFIWSPSNVAVHRSGWELSGRAALRAYGSRFKERSIAPTSCTPDPCSTVRLRTDRARRRASRPAAACAGAASRSRNRYVASRRTVPGSGAEHARSVLAHRRALDDNGRARSMAARRRRRRREPVRPTRGHAGRLSVSRPDVERVASRSPVTTHLRSRQCNARPASVFRSVAGLALAALLPARAAIRRHRPSRPGFSEARATITRSGSSSTRRERR